MEWIRYIASPFFRKEENSDDDESPDDKSDHNYYSSSDEYSDSENEDDLVKELQNLSLINNNYESPLRKTTQMIGKSMGRTEHAWGVATNNGYDKSSAGKQKVYTEDTYDVFEQDGYQYFAVFDGHGGDGTKKAHQRAWEFVQSTLRRNISSKIDACLHSGGNPTSSLLQQIIVDSILQAESDWLALQARGTVSRDYSGTTLVIGLIAKNVLVAANVGDSEGVICFRDDQQTVNETEENVKDWCTVTSIHSISQNESEYNRIQKAVEVANSDPSLSDYERAKIVKDRISIRGASVNVSRSVGDGHLKASPIIIADPSVREIHLSQRCWFLIFASDGVWNALEGGYDEAVSIVKDIFNSRNQSEEKLCTLAAEELIGKSLDRIHRMFLEGEIEAAKSLGDNLTALVIHFNPDVIEDEEKKQMKLDNMVTDLLSKIDTTESGLEFKIDSVPMWKVLQRAAEVLHNQPEPAEQTRSAYPNPDNNVSQGTESKLPGNLDV